MNYCKYLSKFNLINHSFHNYRFHSGLCTASIQKPVLCDLNNYINKNYSKSPTIINRRHLSLEGLVKWQTEMYTSISNSYPVSVMQDGLLHFHDLTGLTWWATIVASTVLIRIVITLPLSIYQNYILAKVENIGLELKDMVNEMKKETALAKKVYNLTDKQAVGLFKRSLKKQWRLLIERDNCHPVKASLLIWFQIPIWVCMSFALRNLVYMQPPDASSMITFLELSVGGISWFPNLTVADHSYILPVIFGVSNLSIIELQRMSKLRKPSRLYTIFTNGFRIFSVVMIPVAASVPSCMCLYWVTSSTFGLAQNIFLLSPTIRRKLGIPEAPSELEDPYAHIKEEIISTVTRRPRKTPVIASIYTSGRDENNFSDPTKFLPYRWDRNDPRRKSLSNHVSSASLPFALGARSCIGKKIAMLQLTEVISQIVINFDFKCSNDSDVKPITSQVLIPDKTIQLTLHTRKV